MKIGDSMNSKEIAKLAGVSRSTVSRVINNYSNVPEETRRRVMEVVEKYKYVPHASARILAGGDSGIIGFFMIDKKNDTAGHKVRMSSYFIPFLVGVIDTANQCGYNVLVSTIDKSSGYKSVRNMFYNKTISGGIFIGQVDDPEIDAIIEEGYKTVVIDRLSSDIKRYPNNIIIINADNFAGAYQATQYLISLGHKKIAHVTGYAGQLSTVERIEGYKKALCDHNIEFDNSLLVKGNFIEEGGYTATLKLLQKKRPTAIFYGNDSMALGGIRAIKELGMRVPDDISVVGFDDIEAASFCHPALTTVRQPMAEMSENAVKTLVSLLKNETECFAQYVMPVQFIERQSCKQLSSSQ